MNYYIDAQCKNMVAMVNTFLQACELAAKQDDGSMSKEELKTLKRITKAADAFKAELNRI